MKKLMVIGIGNRIMGDDGVGVYVVEELIKQNFMPDIEYVIGETDVDYCLDRIGNADLTIIIDAAITGKVPGTLTEFVLDDRGVRTGIGLSTHNFNIVEIAEKLNGEGAGSLILLGIEPAFIDYKFRLSNELQKSFGQFVEDIKRCIIRLKKNICED